LISIRAFAQADMKGTSRRPRESAHKLEAAHSRPSEAKTAEGEFRHNDGERIDAPSSAFLELDRAGRIRKVNQEGARLLGFSADWLRGKSFVVFVARQDTDRFLKLLRESVHTPSTQVIDLDMHVGNSTVAVQLSLKTTVNGTSISHQLTIVNADLRDVDIRSEEALANWQALVHNAPDTLMTVGDQGRIYFVNKPLWGYSVKALIGTNIVDLIPEEERSKLLGCLNRGFLFNRNTTCEITGIEGQGNAWFLFTVGAPDKPGTERSYPSIRTTTVTIRDISEARHLADTLRDSREQLSDFAGRLEAAREEERVRLARELHDELGQSLTVVKIELEMIQSKPAVAGDVRQAMKMLATHVDEILERVRDLSLELQPTIMLAELGLLAAIKWQVAEFEKITGIPADVVSKAESLLLPSEVSFAAYRVIQEAFTNVMRHADASYVRVNVDLMEDGLRISIVDNGKGMTRAQESDMKSLGIVGMKERISRLRGDFSIASEVGNGTEVRFFIPTNLKQLDLPFHPRTG
jgi:PAS domain S-box-containing protein